MPKAKASILALLTAAAAVAGMFFVPYSPPEAVRTTVVQSGEWMRCARIGGIVSCGIEPCITTEGGIVRRIHAEPGQAVRKGQLLFSMDTSAQEAALKAITQARYTYQQTAEKMGESIEALAISQELEWMQTELVLRAQIEAAQIRAQTDGVLDRIYVQEGQYAAKAHLLGSVSTGEKEIIASASVHALSQAELNGLVLVKMDAETLGIGIIQNISAPDDTGMQQLVIRPVQQEQFAQCEAGEYVSVEWVEEQIDHCALIPIGAVDAQSHVWFVSDGRAYPKAIDTTKRNGECIAAGEEWENCRIVLEPEGLREGCRVKEAKKQ